VRRGLYLLSSFGRPDFQKLIEGLEKQPEITAAFTRAAVQGSVTGHHQLIRNIWQKESAP
jgi:hypothetical protein